MKRIMAMALALLCLALAPGAGTESADTALRADLAQRESWLSLDQLLADYLDGTAGQKLAHVGFQAQEMRLEPDGDGWRLRLYDGQREALCDERGVVLRGGVQSMGGAAEWQARERVRMGEDRYDVIARMLRVYADYVGPEETLLAQAQARVDQHRQAGEMTAFDGLLADCLDGWLEERLTAALQGSCTAMLATDADGRLALRAYVCRADGTNVLVQIGEGAACAANADTENLSLWSDPQREAAKAVSCAVEGAETGDAGSYYAVAAQAVVQVPATARGPQSVPKLVGHTVKWPAGKTYDVYYGYTKSFGRGAEGKAKVSTNGPITVFGALEGAVLVRYEISQDRYRFGWVLNAPDSVLAACEEVPFSSDMNFDSAPLIFGTLRARAALTDDPDGTRSPIAQLAAGSSLRCLAGYGDWMYVESFVGETLRIGFVNKELVDLKHGYVQDVEHSIDRAETFSEAEILAAMAAVEAYMEINCPGEHLLCLRYVEGESTDPNNVGLYEGDVGMELYGDVNDYARYLYEISGAVAQDLCFTAWKDDNGWHGSGGGYK